MCRAPFTIPWSWEDYIASVMRKYSEILCNITELLLYVNFGLTPEGILDQ